MKEWQNTKFSCCVCLFVLRKASFKQSEGLTSATSWDRSLRNKHTIKTPQLLSARAITLTIKTVLHEKNVAKSYMARNTPV